MYLTYMYRASAGPSDILTVLSTLLSTGTAVAAAPASTAVAPAAMIMAMMAGVCILAWWSTHLLQSACAGVANPGSIV